MKVCLVVHGYPPELTGGTEETVRTLAHGLAERGHEVLVVAGSIDHAAGFRTSEERDGPVRVVRIHRADLFFDHWHKSASARVARAFRELLAAERPDLVHVHHWIRLSRDLVFEAAHLEIPAVVTLHDLWTTCLVTFRVRPASQRFCEARLGPDPCLDCVAAVRPRTPWVSREQEAEFLHEREVDLLRELELARAVVVPSRAHGDAVGRFLGLRSAEMTVVRPGRDLDFEARAPLAVPTPNAPLVLGAWGHLGPLKGQDLLLDALERIAPRVPIRLHIAGGEGDPEFARALRERAARLDVRFHGPFELSELPSHPVTAVHAMVSGTRALESFGLVIDEAVALGLPMVLPRAGAFAERLADGDGVLLYDSGSAASLAAALERLATDPGLLERLRARLPDPQAVTPSVGAHLRELLAVYDSVLAAGPPEPPPVDPDREARLLAQEEAWDEGYRRANA